MAMHTCSSAGPQISGLSYHGGFGHDVVFVASDFNMDVWQFDRNVPHKELDGHTGPVVAICSVEGSSGGSETPSRQRQEHEAMPEEHECAPPEEMSLLELAKLEAEEEAASEASGHTHGMESVSVFSASIDNSIRNWDPKEMVCRLALSETRSELRSMVYAPVNRLVCTGNDDGSIRLWHPEGGTPLTCEGHHNTISSLDVGILHRQEYLFSGSYDGSVAVWDISRRQSKQSLVVNHIELGIYEVQSIKFCEHLGTLLAGCNDGVIYVYDPVKSICLKEFRGHEDSVTCLALDGNFLVSGSQDRTIKLWNLLSEHQETHLVKTLPGHRRTIEDLLVLAQSGHLVSCATDGHIKCWDYTAETVLHEIKLEEEFLCMDYKKSTHQIVAGTESHKVLLFTLPLELGGEHMEPVAEEAATASPEAVALESGSNGRISDLSLIHI
eukprot:TRINITY_DN10801_c0_g1_i6.p2 TRINITY_DN10801_c0_g1~~TRINITY_DN10801_c0_g1_i6.p2  ORF type:complete len:440 (-),score=108.37 TRINITY_DN10801_c0_g1_i6:178-1497(-)